MRILVVEDEIDLCNAIKEGLEIDGYAVDACYDGENAYELMLIENYDLVILDNISVILLGKYIIFLFYFIYI